MYRSLLVLTGLLQAASTFGASLVVQDQAEFQKVVAATATLEKLGGDMGFIEGPIWDSRGNVLLFSDIPGNELKKWSKSGGVARYRQPSNNANGNTVDREGRLLSAEHGARRISRTEKNGEVVTVVDQYEGAKLNSPNDVVVKSDGTIYFTDPDYGLAGRPKEQKANHVFRFDPATQKLTALVKDFVNPNGLCFSPDERLLFVADSGKPRHIRVFEVQLDGGLSNGRVFAVIANGGPDGIRSDRDGRIWSSAGDGVHVFGTNGALLGKILVPESPANLAFGGGDGKQVFITARKSLYVIPTLVTGAARP